MFWSLALLPSIWTELRASAWSTSRSPANSLFITCSFSSGCKNGMVEDVVLTLATVWLKPGCQELQSGISQGSNFRLEMILALPNLRTLFFLFFFNWKFSVKKLVTKHPQYPHMCIFVNFIHPRPYVNKWMNKLSNVCAFQWFFKGTCTHFNFSPCHLVYLPTS